MTRTRPALAARPAALALALSGCGVLGSQEDPAPAPDAPQAPDASDEGGTNSAAMTSTAEPGTRAVVGEALPVHVQALQEGEEYFGDAVRASRTRR